MDYETLALTRPADGVAVLTLTRPRQRNAITFQMFDEMHDLLAKVRKDRIEAVVADLANSCCAMPSSAVCISLRPSARWTVRLASRRAPLGEVAARVPMSCGWPPLVG